ncbi:MAG: HAD-IC family P-type ATPase [Patescibacteria group bacterium]|jgi:Ca2+-transporting ATPase
MAKKQIEWHHLKEHQAIKELSSDIRGLDAQEIKKRSKNYGYNILLQKKSLPAWKIFVSQFKSALVYVLLVGAVISFLFKEVVDAYVIILAVVLNVVIGFLQEYKANNSLAKLSQVIKQQAIVRRDNHQQMIDAKFLVPGDIVILRAGDKVPADLRLLQVNNLTISESALTGESWPIKKIVTSLPIGTVLAERQNMAYMGTVVAEGRGEGVVMAIGLQTELGKIAKLLNEVENDFTPLQIKLDKFAKTISTIIVSVAFVVMILGLVQGYHWAQIFTVAVALAVSAIPEGLLISLTVILTVGMQRILKKQGLVRQLVSAETLGATTVICADKTGTLTEGEMRVTELLTIKRHIDFQSQAIREIKWDKDMSQLIDIAILCNDAVVQNPDDPDKRWEIFGTPTEKALLFFAMTYGDYNLQQKKARLEEIPFDSSYKFMVTRYSHDAEKDIIYIKGAPEIIIPNSIKYTDNGQVLLQDERSKKIWHEELEHLSKRGLRVLAGAYRLVPKNYPLDISVKKELTDLVMVGLWGLSDPLRPEMLETLEQTKKAGIKTVMITGDSKFTAFHIAQSLKLATDNDQVVTGDELIKMSDKQLNDRVEQIKVYARVTPSDKLRIIQAWKARGEVVAMTGDGVNDAPALKAADVGVTVSTGSDIAKEVADLILLDNNFRTIVMAIKEGRLIFANLKKVILYLLSDSFSEITIIAVAMLLGYPLPILTTHILWINLITDGLPSLALTQEPEDKDIMEHRERPGNSLLDFEGKFLIFIISVLTTLGSLGLYYYFWKSTGDLALARTIAFASLGISTLLYIYSIKNLEKNIFKSNPFKNHLLNLAVVIGVLLQIAAVYVPFLNHFIKTVPLNWWHWQAIILMTVALFVLLELIKMVFIHYHNRHHSK